MATVQSLSSDNLSDASRANKQNGQDDVSKAEEHTDGAHSPACTLDFADETTSTGVADAHEPLPDTAAIGDDGLRKRIGAAAVPHAQPSAESERCNYQESEDSYRNTGARHSVRDAASQMQHSTNADAPRRQSFSALMAWIFVTLGLLIQMSSIFRDLMCEQDARCRV